MLTAKNQNYIPFFLYYSYFIVYYFFSKESIDCFKAYENTYIVSDMYFIY